MPPLKARYHPYLFLFITLCATAQLGLASYLINLGNQIGFAEASYHSLLVGTTLFTFPHPTHTCQFDFICLQFGQSPPNPLSTVIMCYLRPLGLDYHLRGCLYDLDCEWRPPPARQHGQFVHLASYYVGSMGNVPPRSLSGLLL